MVLRGSLYGIHSPFRYTYTSLRYVVYTKDVVPSASNPSTEITKSETSNVSTSFTRNVSINGTCRISSIVRFVIARIFSSSFGPRMSLFGWFDLSFYLCKFLCAGGALFVIDCRLGLFEWFGVVVC